MKKFQRFQIEKEEKSEEYVLQKDKINTSEITAKRPKTLKKIDNNKYKSIIMEKIQ